MLLMRTLGFLLIVLIAVFAVVLYKGATKIEKMILAENDQKGDE